MSAEHHFGFDTRAIHAGQRPDPETGARAMPIYATTSFVFEDAQHAADLFSLQNFGNIYTRIGNPTTASFEERMASLEGGLGAVATASGQSAQLISLLTLCQKGDEIVASNALYGGTFTQFDVTLRRMGVDVTFVDFADPDLVEETINHRTKVLYGETIGNPGCDILDIERYSDMAHHHGIPLVVDNTFATPYLQRPLELGAKLVVHSTTKYLNGHSDVVGGAVVTSSDEQDERLRYQQMATGAVPGPLDCWLVLRATKTLHLRMGAHCRNAAVVAAHLASHPAVDRVLYPGLPDHPGHELAARQMNDFGGMITVDMGTAERAEGLAGGTRLFSLAESLGGVESLISVPARMTHASLPAGRRRAMGLTDGLVRLSVGVEDVDDLVEDLDRALSGLA